MGEGSDDRSTPHEGADPTPALALASVLDALDDVVYVADRDSYSILYVNAAFRRLWGDDVVGRSCCEVLHGRDAACPYCTNPRLFGAHLGETCEWDFRHEGSGRWFRTRERAIRYSPERWARLQVATDITARRALEAELRIKDRVFEDSLAAESVADEHGTITHANRAFVSLWGCASADAAVGRPVSSYFADPAVAAQVFAALAARGTWQGEFVARRADGSPFVTRGYASVLRNRSGAIVGYHSTNLDATLEHAAAAAERERALFAEIVENSSEAMTLVSRDLVYLQANQSYLDLWGREARDLVGHRVEEVVGAELFQRTVGPNLERSLRGERHRFLARVTLPGGTLRSFDALYAPCYAPDGTIHAVAICLRDVTDRVAAEESLRQSERRLAQAQRIARVGSWEWEPGREKLTWSDELYRLFGLPRDHRLSFEGIVGQIHPEDRESNERFVAHLLGEATSATLDFRVVTPDGELKHVQEHAEVQRDEVGAVTRVVGTMQDLTPLRHAEAALRAEHANLDALLSATPTALLLFDDAQRLVRANPAARTLFALISPHCGAAPGEAVGCAHRTADPRGCGFGSRCASCGLRRTVLEVLAERSVRVAELTVERSDGYEPLELLVSGEPFRLDGRRGVLLAAHDITELRRAQRVRDELQASLAQADRLSSIGMLAAGVAHEINNPLCYVLYNLESLVEELAAPDGSEPPTAATVLPRLRDALSGTLRIQQIARALGTFSRVESVEVGPVDVEKSVEHALTMAFTELKHRARIVKDLTPVPPVLATDGKLAQVFLNLLVNAAHAIEPGRVRDHEVRLRTYPDGESVCIEVRDTGRGIAPEHQAKVFDAFFTTKGVGVGSGLGLSISRNIVESFGGTISFASTPGVGTRFTVRLPALPQGWLAPEAPPHSAARALVVARGRLLVVDDEPNVRSVLVHLLGRDHEVVVASGGDHALLILEQDRAFDLIFCDLMMPTVTGVELHTWLLERDPALAGQVVFMTGAPFAPGTHEYLVRAGNLRIEKPFDAPNLRHMVGELVLAAHAKRGAREPPTPRS